MYSSINFLTNVYINLLCAKYYVKCVSKMMNIYVHINICICVVLYVCTHMDIPIKKNTCIKKKDSKRTHDNSGLVLLVVLRFYFFSNAYKEHGLLFII